MQLEIKAESFPIKGVFRIARGVKTHAHVVCVTISENGHQGRGECLPYARYGETVDGVMAQIETIRAETEAGLSFAALQTLLPPGAARNALDCALWDLKAKQSGVRVYETLGYRRLSPLKTAFTISLDTPDIMREQAKRQATRPMLKLKIGTSDDIDRIKAVRQGAPKSRIIVDANEGLDFDTLRALMPDLLLLDVQLIEQPLPVSQDEALLGYKSPIPLCADESLHSCAELKRVSRLYSHINIKLDKTGGLTEALALKTQARAQGLGIMVGCMVATSLSMAPAHIVAQGVDFVDLDGAMLLAQDREPALNAIGSILEPPEPDLWG